MKPWIGIRVNAIKVSNAQLGEWELANAIKVIKSVNTSRIPDTELHRMAVITVVYQRALKGSTWRYDEINNG